jgi:hypothetical protein
MQEEVAKHTKKIYGAIQNPGHTFWEKVKEVTVEILIIVFAVTLSIWLHAWSDNRHEQAETHEFLQGLKSDLAKDIRIIDENKQTIIHVDSNFTFLRTLNDNHNIDTASDHLINHYLDFELCTTHPNIGRYEGFKSSGKIGTIENDSLKQNILVYYQQTIPGLNDIEDIANSFQTRIMTMQIDEIDRMSARALAKTFKMRALLEYATGNLEAEIRTYDQAQQQAKKIIALIDRQSNHPD